MINKKKRTSGIIVLAVQLDHRMKIKENEKTDIDRELKNHGTRK